TAYNTDSTFGFPNNHDSQTAPVKVVEDWTMTFTTVGTVPPPPDPVTGLQATVSDGRVDLAWTNPATAFDQVRMVRKAGSAPADPTDGTVVYAGTGQTVTDGPLVNGTLYNYAAWVVRSGKLSTAARTSATPAAASLDPATGLQAAVSDLRV